MQLKRQRKFVDAVPIAAAATATAATFCIEICHRSSSDHFTAPEAIFLRKYTEFNNLLDHRKGAMRPSPNIFSILEMAHVHA